MRLPVSTLGMTLIVGGIEPVVDRSTGAVRIDRESGRPLFTVHVMHEPVGRHGIGGVPTGNPCALPVLVGADMEDHGPI